MNPIKTNRKSDAPSTSLLTPRATFIVLLSFLACLTITACETTSSDVQDSPSVDESESVAAEAIDEDDDKPEYNAEDLESFDDENYLTGYRTADGEVVIEAQYMMAFPFTEHGIAAVRDDDGWAYIDPTGEIVVRTFEYDNGPDYFSQGLARYIDDDQFGFINEKAHIVIEAQFDFASPFNDDGIARVCADCELNDEYYSEMTGGSWWTIDKEGEKIEDIKAPQ